MASSADEDMRRAHERLKVRAELRSMGDDEDSQVIEQEALSRRPKSTPAAARGLVAVLRELPPWSRPVVVVVLIAAVAGVAIATGKVAGWF